MRKLHRICEKYCTKNMQKQIAGRITWTYYAVSWLEFKLRKMIQKWQKSRLGC